MAFLGFASGVHTGGNDSRPTSLGANGDTLTDILVSSKVSRGPLWFLAKGCGKRCSRVMLGFLRGLGACIDYKNHTLELEQQGLIEHD